MVIEKTIIDQLVDIYRNITWQNQVISDEDIAKYYQYMIDRKQLFVVEDSGRLLGYYERRFNRDICFLINVYVIPEESGSMVFRKLYKHFFATMPLNIKYVQGEKQKLKGRVMIERISNIRRS